MEKSPALHTSTGQSSSEDTVEECVWMAQHHGLALLSLHGQVQILRIAVRDFREE